MRRPSLRVDRSTGLLSLSWEALVVPIAVYDEALERRTRGRICDRPFLWFPEERRFFAIPSGGGFPDYDTIIAANTIDGAFEDYWGFKASITTAAAQFFTLWRAAGQPITGAQPATIGGDILTGASTGAWGPTNPTVNKSKHGLYVAGSDTVAVGELLLYDRLWHGRPLLNTTAQQTVNSPAWTRYANGPGVKIFIEVGTVLAAGAHNWTLSAYTDQDGASGNNGGANTGISAAAVDRLDHSSPWLTLAANDTGVRSIQGITLSATIATGAVNMVACRPITWLPILGANVLVERDLVLQIAQLPRLYGDGTNGPCLAWAVMPTNTTSSGVLTWSMFYSEK